MRVEDCLIQALSVFISFCEEHHLSYCGASGTVLGAIRHHGFIPWDDDIDVYMPRQDYECLLELSDQLPTPYKIVDISEMGYTAPFAKFVDASTSIWEVEQVPYMLGAYIDIFPLDDCPDDYDDLIRTKEAMNETFFLYFHSLYQWKCTDLIKFFLTGQMNLFKKVFGMKFYHAYKKKTYYHQLRTLLEKLASASGDRLCASLLDPFDQRYIYEKKWFESYIDVEFENIKIKVPSGYDAYLHYLYGEYMQLPPIEDRKSHHERYYVNLEKGLSIEEAKKIINKQKR